MSKPAANHCNIDIGGYKRNRSRVAKSVRGDSFFGQGWNLLDRRRYVLLQLEANTGSSQGMPVPIDEDPLIFSARLSF